MITLKINNIDRSDWIDWKSLNFNQVLTNEVDTVNFVYKKYGLRNYLPKVNDEITLYEGTSKIFGGNIINITEKNLTNPKGIEYKLKCVDYSAKFNNVLVSKVYETISGGATWDIASILQDLITNFAPTFTTNNVIGTFVVQKVVFNETYLSECIKQLAEMVKYDWYVDEDKDLHFFPKETNLAPYGLTDVSGNYIHETLVRKIDGSQIVNQVKVRGGEGDGATYTDTITVKGNVSKTFLLPYKFTNLIISLDTGSGLVPQTVGRDQEDDPANFDCLYNYNQSMVKFPNALADTNQIQFSGNPKVPILSIISNSGSIALYGLKEKIINDSSIVDITVARSRAKAELQAYQFGSDKIIFDTYTSGLRQGMLIVLDSDKRESIEKYIITEVSFKTKSPTEFYYSVKAITTNEEKLTNLLQKLTRANQGSINENVIAETILTDYSDVDILEIVKIINPTLDALDLKTSEAVEKDPIGAGVEPIWVLAPYYPTSPSDPKRVGLLDTSLKLY